MSGLRGIRLVPDATDPTLGLSKDEALREASAAFTRAKKAQARLVADLHLTERLMDPPARVSHATLRGMRREAEQQVERAQAVVLALIDSMAALERYRDPRPTTHRPEESHDE